MSELGKFSPQHRGGLDAGDTDSVELTPDNHGPHRNDRKQTANGGKHGYKVPQLPYPTRQIRPQRYPNTATLARTSAAVYRDIEAGANLENFQYELMANLPRIYCPKCAEYYVMYFETIR